jgi:hypothetical protein
MPDAIGRKTLVLLPLFVEQNPSWTSLVNQKPRSVVAVPKPWIGLGFPALCVILETGYTLCFPW